jgi:signal-transduction protein with cAMP-binding, CBS, and nucleotidyltransferase domain
MAEHQVTSIIVNTDTSTPGIVTQDDVFTCHSVRLNEIQVKDLPIRPTQHVKQTLTCEDAIKLMIRRGCRKLIVTKNTQNIGLFTLSNLITNLPVNEHMTNHDSVTN